MLTPFNDIIAVSRKIHSSEERKRLQKIIEAIKPKNFGVIVRTAAEGKHTTELHEDLLSPHQHLEKYSEEFKRCNSSL